MKTCFKQVPFPLHQWLQIFSLPVPTSYGSCRKFPAVALLREQGQVLAFSMGQHGSVFLCWANPQEQVPSEAASAGSQQPSTVPAGHALSVQLGLTVGRMSPGPLPDTSPAAGVPAAPALQPLSHRASWWGWEPHTCFHSSLQWCSSHSPCVQLVKFSPFSLISLYFCPSTGISMWFLFFQLGIHWPAPLEPPSFPHHLACMACTVPSFFCPFVLCARPSSIHAPSLWRSLFHSLWDERPAIPCDVEGFVFSKSSGAAVQGSCVCLQPPGSWAQRSGLCRAAPPAALTRDQALQDPALQQLWAFGDLSQCQVLIGSSWGLNLLSPAGQKQQEEISSFPKATASLLPGLTDGSCLGV